VKLGRYDLHAVRDGTFALDGGAMFGVVPRPLAMDRAAKRVILVDDGMGDKWDAKKTEMYGIDKTGGDLLSGLSALGIAPEEVTDLLLTHLHFDHAGGTTRRGPDGALALTFPRAVHYVQRRAWQWAHGPSEKDSGSFLAENFDLLQHSNLLHLVDGTPELFPDVELIVSDGHTVAQQLPRFHADGTHLTFCGDVVPTSAHLKPSWIMGYDLHPLTIIEEKKLLVAQALEDDGWLFFEHDPVVAAARLEERGGQPSVREAVEP
jgi:glyoxylase-like metal-dependent hydrolase (beta-lactamase superfamily II)